MSRLPRRRHPPQHQQLFPGTQVEGAPVPHHPRHRHGDQEDGPTICSSSTAGGTAPLRRAVAATVEATCPSACCENFEVDGMSSCARSIASAMATGTRSTSCTASGSTRPHAAHAVGAGRNRQGLRSDRRAGFLIHHPFDSFTSVETFLRSPSRIRTSSRSRSPYAHRRQLAAGRPVDPGGRAGKQVAVLVELKARFDERNNIVGDTP